VHPRLWRRDDLRFPVALPAVPTVASPPCHADIHTPTPPPSTWVTRPTVAAQP